MKIFPTPHTADRELRAVFMPNQRSPRRYQVQSIRRDVPRITLIDAVQDCSVSNESVNYRSYDRSTLVRL